MVSQRLDSFLRGDEPSSVGASLLRGLLSPAAGLYLGGATWVRWSYRRGLRKKSRLPVPVISVGNLTVGGTGKTPFVRALGTRLLEAGIRPLVLSRGYGARSPGSPWDEEGASLVRDVPNILLAQGKDRFQVAKEVLQGVGSGGVVAILDDGAQSHRFHRDLDVFLLDARRPFGSGWVLPAGALRERASGLRRAHLVALTRCNQAGVGDADLTEAQIRSAGYGGPIVRSEHRPAALEPGGSPPGDLLGRSVWLVSGIAQPESFRRSVEGLGGRVVGVTWFSDHHRYQLTDVQQVEAQAVEAGAEWILTTGKDWAKVWPLTGRSGAPPLRYLDITVTLDADGWAALWKLIDPLIRLAREAPDPPEIP